MTDAIKLGQVDLPEGLACILDPGLAHFWCGDGVPKDPTQEQQGTDFKLVGPDAEAAGRAYDREFDPLYLFDRTSPAEARAHFEDWAKGQSFEVALEALPNQLDHVRRCHSAIAAGPGLGVVKYGGLWGVAIGGLPRDRPLELVGVPLGGAEFPGRWDYVDLIVDAQADVASEHDVEGVMVDHGLLAVGDPRALAEYGAKEGHHEEMLAGLKASEHDATEVGAQGRRILSFANRWGDGMFTMSRLCDAAGRTVRVRAKLGTPKRQAMMRQVWLRALGCIVTKKVVEEGLPVRFAERMKRNGHQDSGWFLCSGAEDQAYMDDAANFAIITVSSAIKICEPFAEIVLEPEGSKFTLVEGRFVED